MAKLNNNNVTLGRLPQGMILDAQTRATGREWGWKAIGYIGCLADGWYGPYTTKRAAIIAANERGH